MASSAIVLLVCDTIDGNVTECNWWPGDARHTDGIYEAVAKHERALASDPIGLRYFRINLNGTLGLALLTMC